MTYARVIVRGAKCVALTRLWVAEHRGAAAEGGAAAIVTAAATTAAQAAPPYCRHHLDLFSGAHWRNSAKDRKVRERVKQHLRLVKNKCQINSDCFMRCKHPSYAS